MNRILAGFFSSALVVFAVAADASVVTEQDAARKARAWAGRGRLGVTFSASDIDVRRYADSSAGGFYGVRFGASGTVFVAGDSRYGSILAFSRTCTGDLPVNSPLYALLKNAVLVRKRSFDAEILEKNVPIGSETELDDIRVSPFVRTKWSQQFAYASSNVADKVLCYNKYTPQLELKYVDADTLDPIKDADTYFSPCGCVATAMAQVMRYWKSPSATREAFSGRIRHPSTPFTIEYRYKSSTKSWEISNSGMWDVVIKNVDRDATDYRWDLMVEEPLSCREENGALVWYGEPVTDEQCDAIGTLTYDCGVAAGLEYSYESTGLDVSDMAKIPYALTNVFGYAQAVLCDNANNLTRVPAVRDRAILANLDARRPVILLVAGDIGGHAVIADGYGYLDYRSTPYVHLNMGWSGQNDVWYNLPDINVGDNPEEFSGFSELSGVIYNITPDETQKGEILSGRVTDENGLPVAGQTVTAFSNDVVAATAVTDDRGIYHFVLPAGNVYEIYTERLPQVALYITGRIGMSGDEGVVGNRCNCDLRLALPAARVEDRLFPEFSNALEYALRKGGKTIEVLRMCYLGKDFDITADVSIVATNSVPQLSPVKFMKGVAMRVVSLDVVDGARLTLSNIVFEAHYPSDDATVNVAADSFLAVSGAVSVDMINTAVPESFLVTGPIWNALTVRCSAAAAAGDCFGYGYGIDAESAGCIGNAYDLTIGGSIEGDRLVWSADAPVPDGGAYARFIPASGGAHRNFRSLDLLLASAKGPGGMLVIRRCQLTAPATVSTDRELYSGGYSAQVWVAGDGSITVDSGAKLTVSNFMVSGASSSPLFKVGGSSRASEGHLVLSTNAWISGFTNTRRETSGGAVYARYGTVSLLPGSSISECSVPYAGSNGAGVYLASGLASLELAGGAIRDCSAGGYGGGVYASALSTVSVSAPSAVTGCVSSNASGVVESNVYLANGGNNPPVLQLTGDASGGSIGVTDAATAPAPGVAFMKVATDAATATNSASAFFDDSGFFKGAVSPGASSLVWEKAEADGQCDPMFASAYVVFKDSGVTNWYDDVDLLLSRIDADATVYFVSRGGIPGKESSSSFTKNYDVVHDLTFCTAPGISGVATVVCTNQLTSIFVRPGGSLTLTNICFRSNRSVYVRDPLYEAPYGIIVADGGTVVMQEGAMILGCRGRFSRADGAITVFNEGVFRMEGGLIHSSTNEYRQGVIDYGVGAGVLVDNGTAYFERGTITGCRAWRYAGAYGGNRGRVYISGETVIDGNFTLRGVKSNLSVQDLSSLHLTGELKGRVGVTDGVLADTNIFGEVDCPLTPQVIAGATNFVNDLTGAKGLVATNSSGKAFLLWSTSLGYGEDVFTRDGETYTVVNSGLEVPENIYFIRYVGGQDAVGAMPDTRCRMGGVFRLGRCAFTRAGYRFAGWRWNGRLYDDGMLVFNLTDVPEALLEFEAVWIAE